MIFLRLMGLALLAVLPACEDIPRDPESTTERVARASQFGVGLVSGSNPGETAMIIDRIEAATGAQAATTTGETSILLDQLEQGKIEVIVGSFAKSSPLKKSVTFSAPLANRKVSPDKPVTRAAMQPGENSWILLVEKAVREP